MGDNMDNKNYCLMLKLWEKDKRTYNENKLLSRLIQWYVAELILEKLNKTV